jgi:2-dehydropantoate 2-reductase
VVTFQNGITGTQVLADKLGAPHVLGGVAKIAAVVAEPGVIRNTGTFAELVFGELDGRPTERVAALAAALETAGVKHEASTNIRDAIWDKMVFLSTFAGVTSLLRLPIGPIRADPDSRNLLRDGLAEALAVARAEGAGLADDSVERILGLIDGLPDEGKSSMLHDLENGRRLEVAWLSGTIAHLGEEHGLAAPTHRLIVSALKLHAEGRPR